MIRTVCRPLPLTLAVTLAAGLTAWATTPPSLPRALDAQRQLVRDRPDDPEALNDLANLLVFAGREAEAEAVYRTALALDPSRVAARFNLALLLQQTGRSKEALEELREVLREAPDYAWAEYQVGVYYEGHRQRRQAVEHYARAFALDPTLTFASVNPHIIENKLVTEALLRSRRYGNLAGTQTPRAFEAPDHILKLMLAPEEATAEDAAETDNPMVAPPADGAPEGMAPPSPEERDDLPRTSETAAGGVPAPGRVITESDLDRGSRVGQVSEPGVAASRRGGVTTRNSDPSLGVVRRQPELERRMSTGSPGSVQTPRLITPPGVVTRRERFFPGRTSTGRLELELLPEEPAAPRAARVERGAP